MAARRRKVGTKVQRIEAWSFSRWSTYDSCPRKAKYTYLDKLPTTTNAAMQRGSDLHKSAELFVRGEYPELHIDLLHMQTEFEELASQPGVVAEDDWAFTRTWGATSWFGSSAWCRARTDAHYLAAGKDSGTETVVIVDYKTGRVYPEKHELQMSLYGLCGLMRYPEAVGVDVEFWYTDQGEIHDDSFAREDQDLLLGDWEKRVAPMLTDTTFQATPGKQACRFCEFSNKKGGPCNAG